MISSHGHHSAYGTSHRILLVLSVGHMAPTFSPPTTVPAIYRLRADHERPWWPARFDALARSSPPFDVLQLDLVAQDRLVISRLDHLAGELLESLNVRLELVVVTD
jgi:hypothetical protein